MSSVAEVADTFQKVFLAEARLLEREKGFVRRRSKMTGPAFVQTLVFGWLSNPSASLEELSQTAATLGVGISPQGLDARFGPAASDYLKAVLEAAITHLASSDPVVVPVLSRFTGVYVFDSSRIQLPAALKETCPGCGGGNVEKTASALKVQVRLELRRGELLGPLLQSARSNDHHAPTEEDPLPKGALRMADTGYVDLPSLRTLSAAGVYWLNRLPCHIRVQRQEGTLLPLWDLLRSTDTDTLDKEVSLGAEGVPARLLAVRVAPAVAESRRRHLKEEWRRHGHALSQERLSLCDWNIWVTNVPRDLLSLPETQVLVKARWQVELLFKLWKSHGHIDEWRTRNPWRVLCEVYGKLLAMLCAHWVWLLGVGTRPDRSWFKAAKTIQRHSLHLLSVIVEPTRLVQALQVTASAIEKGCRKNKSQRQPRTFQRLLAVTNGGLA